jgi:ABC-type dipeptide/oligopeptide/nickel transport system permease component
MLSYVIRRVLLLFPTLLGITLVVFFVMSLAPGGIGGSQINNTEGNQDADVAKAMREYYTKRYGYDKPLIVQYLRWLNVISPIGRLQNEDGTFGRWALKKPDLGFSPSKGRDISDLIAESLPVTLLLNLITFPMVYAISLLAGIRAARNRGGLLDVSSGTAFLGLWSVPTIWAGVMLIGLFANRAHLHWFPTSGLHDTFADRMAFLPGYTDHGFARGWVLDTAWHLVLPTICLTYASFAFLSKLARASVLDNLAADYARTARAKGVDEKGILYRHVLNNSLLPLITVAAGILPGLLAGSVVVESIFSLPGMGMLSVEAVKLADRELVMAQTLVIGFIGLVSFLITDLCYALADPRVSYE